MNNTLMVPGQEICQSITLSPSTPQNKRCSKVSNKIEPTHEEKKSNKQSKNQRPKNRKSCLPKQDHYAKKIPSQVILNANNEELKLNDKVVNKNIEKKMDFFYAPYRVDFVKDCEKFMEFEDMEQKKNLDWSSITKFILNDKKKPFKRALDRLNKIKCNRFERKYHEGTNNKFFDTLLKASKRKIVIVKQKTKEHSPKAKSPKIVHEK